MRTFQILGIKFFGGNSREAVEAITRSGGLLVAPAAPSMINLCHDPDYRQVLLGADLAIADSGFMVLLWKFFTGQRVPRISGLEHVKRLLDHESINQSGAVVWVVPTERSKAKLVDFLSSRTRPQPGASLRTKLEDKVQCFPTVSSITGEDVYVAPKYGRPIQDDVLLDIVRRRRPHHIVVAVGGGTQDRLGGYLLAGLDYRPAVHCVGAAIGFLTGDQIRIPAWADRYYVGWLFRSFAKPTVFVPRFWSARKLPWLIWKYRDCLPPLCGKR